MAEKEQPGAAAGLGCAHVGGLRCSVRGNTHFASDSPAWLFAELSKRSAAPRTLQADCLLRWAMIAALFPSAGPVAVSVILIACIFFDIT
jgi:hypothetical protein